MNHLKRNLLFIFISIFLFGTSYGQEKYANTQPIGLKKNVIYGNLGLIGLGGAVNGNYERMIGAPQNKFINSLWARVGYGFWSVGFGGEGTHFVIGLTALSGSKKGHLELNLGFTSRYDRDGYDIGISNANYSNEREPSKSEYREFLPAGALGYRFQKPNGSFIFRTGLGFPEGVYFSLGFCF